MRILSLNIISPFGLKHTGYQPIEQVIITPTDPIDGARISIVAKAAIGGDFGLIENSPITTGSATYNYKYNGKELQDEFNINLYDYGARNYDPAIGRWFNLDRLSEKYEATSPYAYVANNPVKFIDINGEWIYIKTTTGNQPNNYKYNNGDVYSQQTDDDGNKTWVKVDMSKSKDTDLKNAIALLGDISTSGNTGKSLLDFFNQEGNDLTVFAGHKYNSFDNTARFDKRLSKVGLPVGHGLGTYLLDADPWLILAHEIGHVYSRYLFGKDVNNKKWFNMPGPKSPNQAEIMASHIENMIRAESGIPLRTYYGIETDQNGNNTYRGQLIDTKNRSLFFNNSSPSTIETNQKSVILKVKAENRYKY